MRRGGEGRKKRQGEIETVEKMMETDRQRETVKGRGRKKMEETKKNSQSDGELKTTKE